MIKRIGGYTLELLGDTEIIACACVAGKKESDGPLGDKFDFIYDDAHAGEDSWEKAESKIHGDAVQRAINKSGIAPAEINAIFAGDLLNQCTASTFGIKNLNIPYIGIYGACSTMALSLAVAGVCVNCGIVNNAVASTSSHFCSAEKQFRMPLEYGGQKPPSAQWTVTGAGAAVVGSGNGNGRAKISKVTFGKICDYGIKDANNMGAAMAPAACSTIADFLNDTGIRPDELDLILTGDLGAVGSVLLKELLIKEKNIDISSVHADCGMLIFDINKQKDVCSGGSGCGCSAVVLCSDIMNRIENGEFKKVLFVGTGALLSGTSALQNESIPAVAHAVLLTGVN